jgi:hypothetical protein
MLTVKKRAAWNPAWPCPALKVQWRFHHEGDGGGGQMVQTENLDAKGEYAQVHDVPRASNQAELDQLHPVVRPEQARADPDVKSVRPLRDGRVNLVAHPPNRTRK